MRQDEIVADEIRKRREAHAAKYNYNLDAIYKAFLSSGTPEELLGGL